MRHLRSRLKIQGMHPYPSSLRGGGFKISEIFILVGVLIFLEGGGLSRNLEVKIKTA